MLSLLNSLIMLNIQDLMMVDNPQGSPLKMEADRSESRGNRAALVLKEKGK
jgi:hypothetical protein